MIREDKVVMVHLPILIQPVERMSLILADFLIHLKYLNNFLAGVLLLVSGQEDLFMQ